MIGLTTHVLDAVHGAGAAGVRVDLSILDRGHYRPLRTVHTRENGRAELLSGEEMASGEDEIMVARAGYLRRRGVAVPDPSFFDEVPVRFGIADARRHYHVPLIASPWTYSTYRGGLPPKGE